uniref:Uncharacterized protein n=1 Tax=Plectus sambesii TaxID=2011161 RepID=A0A914UKW7_9BILA
MSLIAEENLKTTVMEAVAPLWNNIKLQSEQLIVLTAQISHLLAFAQQPSFDQPNDFPPLSPSATTTSPVADRNDGYSKAVQRRRSTLKSTLPDSVPIQLQKRYRALALHFDLRAEVKQRIDKAKNAVVVNLPEQGRGETEEEDDDEATANHDLSMIKSVFVQANIPFEGIRVGRHGKKR